MVRKKTANSFKEEEDNENIEIVKSNFRIIITFYGAEKLEL
jgi:hypothetical protein